MEKADINIVWQALFPVKSFGEGEKVELVFDDGNKNFKYCCHIESYEELEEFVKEYNGKVNIAICPNTRTPKKITRRTGKADVKRQKAILLDVEDPENHKLTTPQKVREYIVAFAQECPESVRKAVYYSAYTGGGGQICIMLSRWIEGGEIEIVYEWLKRQLRGIKYVDPRSFNYGQPQRLIGTTNVKYGVQTAIYKVNEGVEPLDVDRILKTWEAEQDLENYTANQIDENKGKIKNLPEAIAEIKKKVRFEKLGYAGESYGDYSKLLCPFHDEQNPSFVVYHNEEGDIGIDFHDDESYDVIKFYQKLYEKDFITAVRELAQLAGIKLTFTKDEKKRIEKEQALAEFDPYGYIADELKIDTAIRYRINGEYYFDFWVRNREDESVPLTIPLFKLLDLKYALRYFGSHTGYKPASLPDKAKEEAWERVIDTFFEVSERAEEFDRSELPWEVEELVKIIREAPATDYMPDFAPSKSRYVKFYDGDTGEVFVSLSALLRRVKVSATFERANIKKVAELLRSLGAKPEKVYKEGFEIRAWKLPEGDWRVATDTTDTITDTKNNSSVGELMFGRVREDKPTDTTDTKINENDTHTADKKETSEVSAEVSEPYSDNDYITDTTENEIDFKNNESFDREGLEATDTTDTKNRHQASEMSEDWDEIDEIPF